MNVLLINVFTIWIGIDLGVNLLNEELSRWGILSSLGELIQT